MASSAPSAPSAPPGTATATPAATTKDDPELDANEVKFDDAAIEHRNAEEVDAETVAAEMAEAGFEDGDDVEEELHLEELEAAKRVRQNMKANSISFYAMLGIEELDAEDFKFDDAAIEHRNAEEVDAAKAPLLVDDRTRAAVWFLSGQPRAVVRALARSIVARGAAGHFLVRDKASNAGSFALSVSSAGGGLLTYLIETRGAKRRFALMGTTNETFDTIAELMGYYCEAKRDSLETQLVVPGQYMAEAREVAIAESIAMEAVAAANGDDNDTQGGYLDEGGGTGVFEIATERETEGDVIGAGGGGDALYDFMHIDKSLDLLDMAYALPEDAEGVYDVATTPAAKQQRDATYEMARENQGQEATYSMATRMEGEATYQMASSLGYDVASKPADVTYDMASTKQGENTYQMASQGDATYDMASKAAAAGATYEMASSAQKPPAGEDENVYRGTWQMKRSPRH